MDNMVEVKTSELDGAALDWAVAKSCFEVWFNTDGEFGQATGWLVKKTIGRDSVNYPIRDFKPSVDWAVGGPLIERMELEIKPTVSNDVQKKWMAAVYEASLHVASTPLVAAMRALVEKDNRYGTVSVPKELVS